MRLSDKTRTIIDVANAAKPSDHRYASNSTDNSREAGDQELLPVFQRSTPTSYSHVSCASLETKDFQTIHIHKELLEESDCLDRYS